MSMADRDGKIWKDGELVDWAGIVDGMRETWPIEYMLPGGAYIDLE